VARAPARAHAAALFRTLIVPLDGSETAERALPYAVRLASASATRVALVRVLTGPHASEIEQADAYLAALSAKLAPAGVQVTTLTPYGDPAARILDEVQVLGGDAIVMASRGRTGLSHLLQGSVAETVLAHSPVPVFLVYARAGDDATPAFDPETARILVPLDGSEYAEAALPFAQQLLGSGGELVLTTVAAPPQHVERDDSGRVRAYLDQQEEALTREAQQYLQTIVADLKLASPDLRASIDVRVGEPAAGIVIAEGDRQADLVVMSTQGRTGVGRAVMGSVAGDVLRAGRVPVVLVGPATARATPPPTTTRPMTMTTS
jgi:nucleotide-binding universal stress UspA family protein